MARKTIYWIISTFILTSIVYLLTFGVNPITKINTNFPSTDGDFLKDMYNTYYHVKYDSSYLHNGSMNYPYGEHFTYTGDNTYISFPLIVLNKMGLGDFSMSVFGLINFHIIASIFLCAIFISLLFKQLKLPLVISIFSSVAITFLTPQLSRIGGHITLSYSFIIPMMLYLFAKMYQRPKYIYVVILALLLIWSGLAHSYYLVFFATTSVLFWLYMYFYCSDKFRNRNEVFLLFFIQFVIPVVIILLLTSFGDTVSDRTKIPGGFFCYFGVIEGILLPYGRSYFTKLVRFSNITWEAEAYIGIITSITFVVLTIICLRKLFIGKSKDFFNVTGNNLLNLFFWISVATLILAMGFPFIYFPENILNYLGPFAQFRAIARFSWLFFYVINIVTIYVLYNLIKAKITKRWLAYLAITLIILCYAFEVYHYVRYYKDWFTSNQLLESTDYENKLSENEWVKNINSDDFQSLLPLPFFSVGTEHILIYPEEGMLKKAIYVSMKTGLPMHTNYSSRTSISKAYNNLALKWNPYTVFPILADFKSEKPILIIKQSNSCSLNENENRIIQYATLLFHADGIDFYKIEINSLRKLCSDYNVYMQNYYTQNRRFMNEKTVYSNDSTGSFYYQLWDESSSDNAFQGNGAIKYNLHEKNPLIDSQNILIKDCETVEISFWMSNFTKDLLGRSKIIVQTTDSNGAISFSTHQEVSQLVANIYNGWGLIRIQIPYSIKYSYINVYIENKEVLSQNIFFDNILVRPLTTNVIFESDSLKLLNNEVVIFK